MDKNTDFEHEIAKAFDLEPSPAVDHAVQAAVARRAWLNRHHWFRPMQIAAAAALVLLLAGSTVFLRSSSTSTRAMLAVAHSHAAGAGMSLMAESLLEVQGLSDDDFLCSDTSNQYLM